MSDVHLTLAELDALTRGAARGTEKDLWKRAARHLLQRCPTCLEQIRQAQAAAEAGSRGTERYSTQGHGIQELNAPVPQDPGASYDAGLSRAFAASLQRARRRRADVESGRMLAEQLEAAPELRDQVRLVRQADVGAAWELAEILERRAQRWVHKWPQQAHSAARLGLEALYFLPHERFPTQIAYDRCATFWTVLAAAQGSGTQEGEAFREDPEGCLALARTCFGLGTRAQEDRALLASLAAEVYLGLEQHAPALEEMTVATRLYRQQGDKRLAALCDLRAFSIAFVAAGSGARAGAAFDRLQLLEEAGILPASLTRAVRRLWFENRAGEAFLTLTAEIPQDRSPGTAAMVH